MKLIVDLAFDLINYHLSSSEVEVVCEVAMFSCFCEVRIKWIIKFLRKLKGHSEFRDLNLSRQS